MMHRTWIVVLFLCAVLLSSHLTQAKKGDDGRWNMPGTSNTNPDKNQKEQKKKKKKDKKKSNFQTSLTFIPPQDLADPKLMKLVNSPWNDKDKKDQLLARVDAFVREKLVDQDKVDTLVKRTRKEWEDLEVTGTSQIVQGMAKILAGILSSPGVHKLLEDGEAQEKIRLFLMAASMQIRNFLDDPGRQKILTNPDQWHELFEKMKTWEGVPHEQVLEEFLDFIDRRTNDD